MQTARAEGVHGEYEAHARILDAWHHAGVADPERRPILTRLSTYPRVRGLVIGAFAETSADVRLTQPLYLPEACG